MSAVIRAKMWVHQVQVMDGQETVVLHPVYSEDGVNKQWSQWTPSGELRLTISNPAAQGRLREGEFFFVDLIPTDEGSL